MKKYILFSIAFMLFFASVKAQVTTQLVTVKDTTFANDVRLNFMAQTIIPAISKFVDDYNRQIKVAGDSLTYKAATNKLLRGIEKNINEYAANFMVIKDIQVDSAAIVKEFTDLNAKIETLQQDPEIKYIEAMSEFQRIQRRQQVLAKYYQQILAR